MSRAAKTEWQRRKRAEAALAAGRTPHRSGRPATGRTGPKCHGDRVGQRQRRREREIQGRGDNGWALTSHPIMEQAWSVALSHARPDRRTHYHDDLFEEVLMTVALAILEGADPHEAARTTARQERARRRAHAPLFTENIAA